MDFTIESSTFLADGSTRYIIRVLPAQLVYFGFFIEAFEGMCLYTTPQKGQPLLQVDVVPDYLQQFQDVLAQMRDVDYC